MNLDFTNCKTPADVKKVFDKKKPQLRLVKKQFKKIAKKD